MEIITIQIGKANGQPAVTVVASSGVTPELGLQVLEGAVTLYREKAIAAEVARRLAAREDQEEQECQEEE